MNLQKLFISTILSLYVLFSFSASGFGQLNFASLQQLNITFKQADFNKFSVSNLQLQVNNLNFKTGFIAYLTVKCTNFIGKNFYLDDVTLKLNNIYFNTDALLKEQEVILKQPVNAEASILISEQNLNRLLNSKKVLTKLANIGNLNIKKFGIQINSGLISFYEPNVEILPDNTIKINMKAAMANHVSFPVSFYTRPTVVDGKIKLTSSRIVTSGIPIPNEVTGLLVTILNTAIDLDRILKDDVTVRIESLQFETNKSLFVKGKALIKKLKLTKRKKEAP